MSTVVLQGIHRLLAALACLLFHGALVLGKCSAAPYPPCPAMEHSQ